MAKYSVIYTKRNSYFSKQHDLLEEVDGRKTVVGKYNKPTAPGSIRLYKPQFRTKPSNKFLIDMTQKELDEIVESIGLLEKDGSLITKANMKNAGDKFFRHNDLYLRIENGGVMLDDEIPMDKFFLACLKADPRFEFIGEDKNPAMSALVEYKVTKAGDLEDEEIEEVEDGMKAMKLFLEMTFDKRVKTLNSMGINTKDPDPDRVEKLLYKKITKEAQEKNSITGETNIDLFLRLASSSTEELSLRAIIGEARKSRIIGKKDGGKFVFGDLVIGRNLEEVYNYLSDDENTDVKTSIIKALKDGQNSD